MKKTLIRFFSILVFLLISVNATAQDSSITESNSKVEKKSNKSKKKKERKKRFKLPDIDLSHWSVTTPETNSKGGALSIQPPEILNYAKDKRLLPYMYNDSITGSLVFYSFPSASKTANTKYTRCELREQLVPGNNKVNWTFAQGAKIKGKLAMGEVSKDSDGKYHRVIIMQIHGILTDKQRDLLGQKDNNAPPILKIYWQNGKIRIKSKILKDLNATGNDLLHEDMWDDDDGFNFEQEVGFEKFTLEVLISEGRMTIVLNDTEFKIYDSIHIKKWGVFENYFKAGNYFQSRDEGSFAKVKYYELEVSH